MWLNHSRHTSCEIWIKPTVRFVLRLKELSVAAWLVTTKNSACTLQFISLFGNVNMFISLHAVSIFLDVATSFFLSFEINFRCFVVPTGGPTRLTVRATSSSSLLVEWNEVRLDLRNGIIEGYRLLLTDVDLQVNISSVVLNESTFSIEFNNLHPFRAYDVSVKAFNRKGNGPNSKYEAFTSEKGKRSK